MEWHIETLSAEETEALGYRLAQRLQGGEVLCLRGELGSGKTTFVQGIAKGLGLTAPIISPTFTLVREYQGALPLFHVDAYRLSGLSPEEVHHPKRFWGFPGQKGGGGVVWGGGG